MPDTAPYYERELCLHLTTLQQVLHTPEAAERIFSALERIGYPLDYYNRKEPVNIPFAREDAKLAWAHEITFTYPEYTTSGNVFLGTHRKPRLSIMVTWRKSTDADCLSSIDISLMRNQFVRDSDKLMWLFRYLIDAFSPVFACIGTTASTFRQYGPPWAKIPGIYWLNYFGKAYVDFLGADHILSCGWHKTETVENGIYTWLCPDVKLSDDAFKALETTYKERLGLQYFPVPPRRVSEEAPPVLMALRKQLVPGW